VWDLNERADVARLWLLQKQPHCMGSHVMSLWQKREKQVIGSNLEHRPYVPNVGTSSYTFL
jgi:hypothetical protein